MKMALLNLKIECRQLFYDRYPYRAKFNINGAQWITKSKNIRDLKTHVENHYNFIKIFKLADDYDYTKVENHDFDKLEKLLDWVNYHRYIFKFRGESFVFSAYGEDLEKLKTVLDIETDVKFTQRIAGLGKYDLYFAKEPKFKYRVYVTTGHTKSLTFKNLEEFVQSHKNNTNYRISPAVVHAFTTPAVHSNVIFGKYFIEFNEPSIYAYLSILFDGKISPMYTCLKQP